MFRRFRHLSRLIALSCLVAPPAFAQEPTGDATAPPGTIRVRVLGLFSPDRVEDLKQVAVDLDEASLREVDYEHAQATFEIDAAKGWQDVADDKLPERIDQALRNASRSTFGATPLALTQRSELTDLEIGVAGLDCKGCAFAAYRAISEIDGVERATVSFRDGVVAARIDPRKTDRAALEEALRKKEVDVVAK